MNITKEIAAQIIAVNPTLNDEEKSVQKPFDVETLTSGDFVLETNGRGNVTVESRITHVEVDGGTVPIDDVFRSEEFMLYSFDAIAIYLSNYMMWEGLTTLGKLGTDTKITISPFEGNLMLISDKKATGDTLVLLDLHTGQDDLLINNQMEVHEIEVILKFIAANKAIIL